MNKHNPNWLYASSRNYSEIKAQALRLGYPFTITQKQYATILPRECWIGHGTATSGHKLLLDTMQTDLGFTVGNVFYSCVRHLGAINTSMECANTRDLIDHAKYKKTKTQKF